MTGVSGPLAADPAGNVYAYVSAAGALEKISPDGTTTQLATKGGTSIAVDANGVVYGAEGTAIFMLNPDGTMQQLAGFNTGDTGTTDGVGTNARFGTRLGLSIDREGNLYVADRDYSTIRKVSLVPYGSGTLPQNVTTIAGLGGQTGFQDGSGSSARFSSPQALAVDQSIGIIYVSDSGNYTIRKITGAATPGNPIPTLAGVTPSSALQGSADTAVTLTGSNFVQGSVVQVGSTPTATTCVNSTSVSVVISAAALASPGTLSISVTNSSPGGGTSGSVAFSVIAPVSQNPMTSPNPTTKPLPIPEVQNGNVQVGYVVVTPDSGTNTPTATLTYGWLQGDGDLLSKAGVLATPLTTSASSIVDFVPSINRDLGVMIANPNAAANTITLTLKDESGTVVGSPVNLILDPYSQIARWVSERFPDAIGASFIGTINLQSSMPFAPLGLAFTGATFSTIAMGESSPPHRCRLDHSTVVVDPTHQGLAPSVGSVPTFFRSLSMVVLGQPRSD